MAARRADRPAERVGQRWDEREVVRAADPPAAGHHDGRLGQFRALAALLRDALGDVRAPGRVARFHADRFQRRGSPGRPPAAPRWAAPPPIRVPVVTLDFTTTAPPKMDCSATGPSSPGVRYAASVSTPEPILTASRPATSLPSAVAGTSTAAGDACATSAASAWRQAGHVVHHAVAVGGVDLGGTVLGQPLRPVPRRTQPDRGGLAEPPGHRQQFERDLLDRLTVVGGENEDLRHGDCAAFPVR